MAVVSRLVLNHPALGTAGGASLHSSVEALYQKIGDAISSRWYQLTDFDNGESVDVTHSFDADISTIRWDLYVYTGGQWVRVTTTSSPARSAFTVAEKVGDEDNAFTITNVSGGNDLLAALVLVNDPLALNEGDITDVDVTTTAPQDGQALVYEESSGKFKPGASGDSSFKLQSVSTPNLTLKGGYILTDDGREIATYDSTGNLSTDFGKDQTLNLDTILGSTPANNTTYYLYVDMSDLYGPVQLTDTKRWLHGVESGANNYKLFTTTPDAVDPTKYIPIGFINTATSGNAWSGTGAAFGTLGTRRHTLFTKFYSFPETFVDETITTAVASTSLNHNLSGEPHGVLLTYDNGTTEVGLDPSGHLLDVTATQIKVASLGLTFGGGQKVRVRAFRFPTQSAISAYSRAFTSSWYTSTATTTVPHGLSDIEDLKGYEVQEWNTTTGRIKNIDRSALVIDFDATNFYLNWTGLTPSATLQYRVVAGGSPLPYAIPLQYGGFTKFVGVGPGSYATLTAAIAASAVGDSILVLRDTTEPAGDLTIGIADLKVVCMPGCQVGLNGALTNGLRLTAARITLDHFWLSLAPSGAQARGISVEAADARVNGHIELTTAQTVTDGVHGTASALRLAAKVQLLATAGSFTNSSTNNGTAAQVNI